MITVPLDWLGKEDVQKIGLLHGIRVYGFSPAHPIRVRVQPNGLEVVDGHRRVSALLWLRRNRAAAFVQALAPFEGEVPVVIV